MIQPFLQAIAQQNPGLAQFMAQNPEAVLQLLGINVDDMAEEAIPPGAQVVSVTESERDAIERVSVLMCRFISYLILLDGRINSYKPLVSPVRLP